MPRSKQQARKPKTKKQKKQQQETADNSDDEPETKKPKIGDDEEKEPQGIIQKLRDINWEKSGIQPPREARNKKEKDAKELGSDLPHGLKWHSGGKPLAKEIPPMVCLDSDTLEGRRKVAGFDIDWTIIATASGRKFATGAQDWKWWDESVPVKLKQLDKDQFRVIFFSNQAGVEKGKVSIGEIQKKCTAIIKELGIPVFVFFSTGESHFRKPNTEMWDFFLKNSNGGVKVDLSESIYVGDAGGRAKDWSPGKPRDFSSSDRMFAANIGVKFHTPEEFFLGEKPAPFTWGSFDPNKTQKTEDKPSKTYHSTTPELVVMVGMPASGKSSFAKKYLIPHGYAHVNRDTLGTPAKCLNMASDSVKAKKSVVIDNTNPSKSARAEYIQLAKKHGMPARCIFMDVPKDVAHHLNFVRQNLTEGKIRRIPDVGYNIFHKNFEEPTTAEGFKEVIKINFSPAFDNDKHKKLFSQWTT